MNAFSPIDPPLKELLIQAAHPFGIEISKIEALHGGRNSQVFKIVSSSGKKLLAKRYHHNPHDARDRITVEWTSLQFLSQQGILSVPEPVAVDFERKIAFYGFISGSVILQQDITQTDISLAVDFLVDINRLKTLPESQSLPLASEAFLSIHDFQNQIQLRLNRFSKLKDLDFPLKQELYSFLEKEFHPQFEKTKTQIASQWTKDGEESSNLKESKRQSFLSPSDFGFHNALRTTASRPSPLVFLDFEYFGWDSPTKMISDFILHPAMNLSLLHKKNFYQEAVQALSLDERAQKEIQVAFPLFALKWALILLNEFLPAPMSRRHFANLQKSDIFALQSQQLKKAKQWLKKTHLPEL